MQIHTYDVINVTCFNVMTMKDRLWWMYSLFLLSINFTIYYCTDFINPFIQYRHVTSFVLCPWFGMIFNSLQYNIFGFPHAVLYCSLNFEPFKICSFSTSLEIIERLPVITWQWSPLTNGEFRQSHGYQSVVNWSSSNSDRIKVIKIEDEIVFVYL